MLPGSSRVGWVSRPTVDTDQRGSCVHHSFWLCLPGRTAVNRHWPTLPAAHLLPPRQTFFSNALAAVGGTTAGPGMCVVNVYVNYEKKFAFVEMRTGEARAGPPAPGWPGQAAVRIGGRRHSLRLAPTARRRALLAALRGLPVSVAQGWAPGPAPVLQWRRRPTRWRWTASCLRGRRCASAGPPTTTPQRLHPWAPPCPTPTSTWRPSAWTSSRCRWRPTLCPRWWRRRRYRRIRCAPGRAGLWGQLPARRGRQAIVCLQLEGSRTEP